MLKTTETAIRAVCAGDPSVAATRLEAALDELRGQGTRELCGEPPPRAFSRAQCAALLGVTPRTVTLYARRGLLVPIFAGRDGRRATAFTGESVAKLLAGGAAMAQSREVCR